MSSKRRIRRRSFEGKNAFGSVDDARYVARLMSKQRVKNWHRTDAGFVDNGISDIPGHVQRTIDRYTQFQLDANGGPCSSAGSERGSVDGAPLGVSYFMLQAWPFCCREDESQGGPTSGYSDYNQSPGDG